jgi:hypothetical protein
MGGEKIRVFDNTASEASLNPAAKPHGLGWINSGEVDWAEPGTMKPSDSGGEI